MAQTKAQLIDGLNNSEFDNINVTGISTLGTVKVSSGIVTASAGIVTYYGDGSQLQGIESGGRDFVASGSISNGDAVIINTNGTVSVVSGVGSFSPTAGISTVFESASTSNNSATFDSSNNKVVIAYTNVGNSSYGTAVVGTVSGTSIGFGSTAVFESASTSEISATYDSVNQKVVIAYRDGGNANYGTAIVGTVSGTSISFGTPVVFESASTNYISATYDSANQKVVIAYRDVGNANYGTAVVGTVSGTSISFGSPVVFESAQSDYISATYDSANQKVVIAYQDGGNSSYGTAIVGTVSGTSISFGSAAVFESAGTGHISATYDSTNQKVVIAYRDAGNSDYGTAVVGTVSGTSISFGTPTVFESGGTFSISAVYYASNQKVVIVYRDAGNSNYGTAVDGTVSGTSISFGSPAVFETGTGGTQYNSATYDSTNQKVVVAYRDTANSNYGTASVITIAPTNISSNLTDDNYIGIAAEAISSGATGKINIVGRINSGQTGLTAGNKYYINPLDGSLSVSPYGEGVPGVYVVVAGTSISSTEIIVKG